MAKFAIACPACGKYAESKTGFFARKKIECACGNIIDVKTDKLASRLCPHCGNEIVFDQTEGADALCPVCHAQVNTMAEQQQMETFSCRRCGVRLTVAKSASFFTCPVCDYENDVQERLVSEKIRKDGLASIIKYEGDNNTFVWKHPIEDFNYGSQLIVHESQEAVFFKDGQALDLFGPGRYTQRHSSCRCWRRSTSCPQIPREPSIPRSISLTKPFRWRSSGARRRRCASSIR